MDRFSFFSEPFSFFNDPFFRIVHNEVRIQRPNHPSLWGSNSRFEPSNSALAVIPARSTITNYGRGRIRILNSLHNNAEVKTSGEPRRTVKRDPEILPISSLGNAASYELRFARPKKKLGRTASATQSSNDMNDTFSQSKQSNIASLYKSEQKKFSKQNLQRPKTGKSERKIDPDLTEVIEKDIVQTSLGVRWEDIAGLEEVKQVFKETFLLPKLMPQLFKGILRPWRGILLFGPPGTGKTLLARAVASQTGSTFFNILPSSLTSMHYGESEKLVRALFASAKSRAPSVVFLDEMDAFCGRGREHEATRRVRCEMLAHMDGLVTGEDTGVVVLAATNHPWDLDEALKRRFEKRIYIPLPDKSTRKQLIDLYCTGLNVENTREYSRESSQNRKKTFSNDVNESRKKNLCSVANQNKEENINVAYQLTKETVSSAAKQHREETFSNVAAQLKGYSGSDIKSLCQEAILAAARELMRTTPSEELCSLESERIMLREEHFIQAKVKCKPSVNKETVERFIKWKNLYGSG